jgi:hypothetical protein
LDEVTDLNDSVSFLLSVFPASMSSLEIKATATEQQHRHDHEHKHIHTLTLRPAMAIRYGVIPHQSIFPFAFVVSPASQETTLTRGCAAPSPIRWARE